VHFSAELSENCLRHFGTGAEVSNGHFDTSTPTQKLETLRHHTDGAEMSWVQSVLGPKCPYTIKKL